jgi:putative redox protein
MADSARWVTARLGGKGFHTNIHAASHHMIADEPIAVGGTDRGPTPYEFLLASLGSCTAMTLRIYADRKGWPLEGVAVHLRSSHSHEQDCEECATTRVDIGRIERKLELEGPLTDEQRSRLGEIANRCPVKQTLERGITIHDADPA